MLRRGQLSAKGGSGPSLRVHRELHFVTFVHSLNGCAHPSNAVFVVSASDTYATYVYIDNYFFVRTKPPSIVESTFENIGRKIGPTIHGNRVALFFSGFPYFFSIIGQEVY